MLKKTVISGLLHNYNMTVIMVNSDIDIFCNYTLQFQRIRKINSYIKLFIEAAPSN